MGQRFKFGKINILACFFVITITVLQSYGYWNQKQQPSNSKKPVLTSRSSIWQDPGRIESLNFTTGPGGRGNIPRPPFTFKKEDEGGSNPKIDVKDSAGRDWGVKWGSEVHSEVFASRIAWAAGYYVEPTYFIKSGKILGASNLNRAKKYIKSDGSFADARFELKEKGLIKLKDEQSWRWDQNPFLGTKQLNGIKIIMMLTSNWDSKDQRDTKRGSNTAIFHHKASRELRYVFTDWGGSMGKWGNYFSREKWDCDGFSDQNSKFIRGVRNNFVEFGYSGQRTNDIRDEIRVSDVRWLLKYIGRISDAQIRAGLFASGATQEEVKCFNIAIRERIRKLEAVAR
jgi:hypothetical protein